MTRSVNLNHIKETAEAYYADGDFYCSEAIVKTLIDAFELDASDDCIKMASGFPVGIGGQGCTCGAVAGGVMAIGLVFGRCIPKDPSVDQTMALCSELMTQFKADHRVTCCSILRKGMTLGSPVHMKQCIMLTGDVAYKAAKIIAEALALEIIY